MNALIRSTDTRATGGLLVRIQPEEPISTFRFSICSRAVVRRRTPRLRLSVLGTNPARGANFANRSLRSQLRLAGHVTCPVRGPSPDSYFTPTLSTTQPPSDRRRRAVAPCGPESVKPTASPILVGF